MKKITASAPGKLMLLGDHAVVYGRACLVTAVGQRMHATVTLLDEPVFQLEAPEVNVSHYQKPISKLSQGEVPKGARFVEQAIKNVSELRITNYELRSETQNFGVRVQTRSEFSSQFGFGSSSSSTVCVVKALCELFDLNLSQKELFDVAYKTVIDIQGVGSGFDIAAGIYGGTLYFTGGGQVIEPITIDSLPLLVGYSGTKGDTSKLVKMVGARAKAHPEIFEPLFAKSDMIVEKGRKALRGANLKEFGSLMNIGETLMESYGVETDKLMRMISSARKVGAWGAKMSGAGGGDCMIALGPRNKWQDMEAAISAVGGELVDVDTNAEGARIENGGL